MMKRENVEQAPIKKKISSHRLVFGSVMGYAKGRRNDTKSFRGLVVLIQVTKDATHVQKVKKWMRQCKQTSATVR